MCRHALVTAHGPGAHAPLSRALHDGGKLRCLDVLKSRVNVTPIRHYFGIWLKSDICCLDGDFRIAKWYPATGHSFADVT